MSVRMEGKFGFEFDFVGIEGIELIRVLGCDK
jgi:hypothetical protein